MSAVASVAPQHDPLTKLEQDPFKPVSLRASARGQAQYDCLSRMAGHNERVDAKVPPTWAEMGTEHMRRDAFAAALRPNAYAVWQTMLNIRDKLPQRHRDSDFVGYRVLTVTMASIAKQAGLTKGQAAEGMRRLRSLALVEDCDGAMIALEVGCAREKPRQVLRLVYSSFGCTPIKHNFRKVWRRVVFGARLVDGERVLVPTEAAKRVRAVPLRGGARPGHSNPQFRMSQRVLGAIAQAYDSGICPPGIGLEAVLANLGKCPGARSRWKITTLQPHSNFNFGEPAELAEFCRPDNFKWERILADNVVVKPRRKVLNRKAANEAIERAFGPMKLVSQPAEITEPGGVQTPSIEGGQTPSPSKSLVISKSVVSSSFQEEVIAAAAASLETTPLPPKPLGDLFTNPAPRVRVPPPELKQRWMALAPKYPSIAVPLTTIPAPPLLPVDATDREMVAALVAAYRTACGNRYGKKCWTLAKFDVNSAKDRNTDQYRRLLDAARVMKEQEIRPISWAAWCCDVWKVYGSKTAFPPLRWLFDTKRLVERANWFRAEEPCNGGRVIWSPARQALHRAWDEMDQALRWCWTEADAKACIDFHCSEAKWERLCEAARARGEEDLELVNRAIRRGEFVW